MKNIIILLVTCTSLFFISCKKNEKQIIGTWTVVKVTKGGTDISSTYIASGYKETYASGGNYSYSGQPGSTASGTGKYAWDNKNTLKRNGVSGQTSVTCTNVDVDRKSLDYSYTDNGEEWVFEFKQ